MVTFTEDTFDVFRFFFSWTLLGEMTAGAFEAAEAAIAVCPYLGHLLHCCMFLFGLGGSNVTLV